MESLNIETGQMPTLTNLLFESVTNITTNIRITPEFDLIFEIICIKSLGQLAA